MIGLGPEFVVPGFQCCCLHYDSGGDPVFDVSSTCETSWLGVVVINHSVQAFAALKIHTLEGGGQLTTLPGLAWSSLQN